MTRWIWDGRKAEANLRKHGVSFEVACRVLDDPLAGTLPDPYRLEERWRTIGKPAASSSLVLIVVHTWREVDAEHEPECRLISPRKAEPHERRGYEKGQF